jgi:hypothetical protein
MVDEANHAGTYKHPANGTTYPKIQIITVTELLAGKRPKLPATMLPYIQASKAKSKPQNETLFDA